jgi:hypothetical protein
VLSLSISRQGPKIARKLFEKIVDEGVAVHVVNLELKLIYRWENHPHIGNRVDGELDRAFKESERKSKIIKAGLKAVKHTGEWAGILPFWLKKEYEPGSVSIASGGKKTEKPKYKIEVIPEKAELVGEIFRFGGTRTRGKADHSSSEFSGYQMPRLSSCGG